MDVLIKILTITITFLSSIFLPIFLNWLKNKNDWHKNKHESFATDLANSREFYQVINGELDISNHLAKDRMAKKVFMSRDINFEEAKYFYGFQDADRWIELYLPVKHKLDFTYNEKQEIINLHYECSKINKSKWMVFYVIAISISVTPYFFFQKYSETIIGTITNQFYLLTVELALFPVFFFFGGILFLLEHNNIVAAEKFIKDFKFKALKVIK